MIPINQTLFTAGQFARLCKSTKETLRHYHNAGILTPAHTGANGYQYYTIAQFYDYQLIRSLKMAGSSLAEIRTYLENRDNHAYLNMLRQKQKQLWEEQKKLEQMERLLSHSINKMETAMTEENRFNDPELITCPEEYLIAFPVPKDFCGTEEETVAILSELMGYCTSQNLIDEFQLGAVITLESLLSGNLVESHYYSRLSHPADSPWLFIKPEGTYVRIYYDGSDDDGTEAAHTLLIQYLKENRLRPCGCLYEEELTVYQNAATTTPYTIQLLLQTEQNPSLS